MSGKLVAQNFSHFIEKKNNEIYIDFIKLIKRTRKVSNELDIKIAIFLLPLHCWNWQFC